MKLRNPLLIRLAACFAALTIRLWMLTVRTRIVSADGRPHPADPAHERFIYAFWHEGLLAPLATRPKARVLISQHRDGELIAQTIGWLGIEVVRGSTSRGGSQAMLEMIRCDDVSTHLAITPDGPKGPRRELQMGTVMIASQAGLSVVPFGVGFVNAWRASSWDRFAVPRPFSTMVGVVGEPIAVPSNLDRRAMNEWKGTIEARMLELTGLAEAWAERLKFDKHAPPPERFESTRPLRQSA